MLSMVQGLLYACLFSPSVRTRNRVVYFVNGLVHTSCRQAHGDDFGVSLLLIL